jgi:hypothetical protein
VFHSCLKSAHVDHAGSSKTKFAATTTLHPATIVVVCDKGDPFDASSTGEDGDMIGTRIRDKKS